MSLNVCAIGEMVSAARKGRGLTQEALAIQAGVSRRAVILLEGGGGRLGTLARIIPHLDLRLTGLAAGSTLGDQIRRTRTKRRLTQAALAARAGISIPTLHSLETDSGLVVSLNAVLTILAPTTRPRLHPRASWSKTQDERFTPPEWLAVINSVYGQISIDPCHHPRSFVQAKLYITKKEDGLATKWYGHLAFVNPPYSASSRWIHRCADAIERREVSTVIALLPFRPETAAFHQRVLGKADLIILRSKPRFFSEDGNRLSIAPFAAYFAVWNSEKPQIRLMADLVGGAIIWADGCLSHNGTSTSIAVAAASTGHGELLD